MFVVWFKAIPYFANDKIRPLLPFFKKKKGGGGARYSLALLPKLHLAFN